MVQTSQQFQLELVAVLELAIVVLALIVLVQIIHGLQQNFDHIPESTLVAILGPHLGHRQRRTGIDPHLEVPGLLDCLQQCRVDLIGPRNLVRVAGVAGPVSRSDREVVVE